MTRRDLFLHSTSPRVLPRSKSTSQWKCSASDDSQNPSVLGKIKQTRALQTGGYLDIFSFQWWCCGLFCVYVFFPHSKTVIIKLYCFRCCTQPSVQHSSIITTSKRGEIWSKQRSCLAVQLTILYTWLGSCCVFSLWICNQQTNYHWNFMRSMVSKREEEETAEQILVSDCQKYKSPKQ